MDITNDYWRMRGWKEVVIRVDDDTELTLEDDDDGEDVFDNLDDVVETMETIDSMVSTVETIDDLFDILEEFLNDGADIYIGTIPTIGNKKDETKEEKSSDAYDRAMKGMK